MAKKQVGTITMTDPAVDPVIPGGADFLIRLVTTTFGTEDPEHETTIYPQYSTNNLTFFNITGSGVLTASPVSREWDPETFNYSFTITAVTDDVYYVRGQSIGIPEGEG